MPFLVADYIAALPVQPWVIIVAILVIYTIAGMVMDALGFLLVSIPIFFPVVVTKMGYDPIWFGCILCVVTTLGAITPPVGICAYVVAGMDKEYAAGDRVQRGGLVYPGILDRVAPDALLSPDSALAPLIREVVQRDGGPNYSHDFAVT